MLYCAGLISSNSDYEYELNGKRVDLRSEQEKGEIRKTKIGYVFQENNLNTRLTVRENIRLSAALAGADTGDARMEELLRQVGLEGRGKEWPNTLSGGEQQRAALACALAKEPELILADEPTSSLDEANTMEILSLLKAAAKAVGEKSVEMIPVSEIQKVTGYIRGGCSPIGMRKQYQTIIDESCTKWGTIIISGGKIGTQIELSPEQLLDFIHGKAAMIAME